MNGPELRGITHALVAAALRPMLDECAETARLFDEYSADSRAREAAHLDRIRSEARRLGKQVGRYELTLTDARARLARLVDVVVDATCPVPLRRVPYAIGRQAAADNFTLGMADAQRKAS